LLLNQRVKPLCLSAERVVAEKLLPSPFTIFEIIVGPDMNKLIQIADLRNEVAFKASQDFLLNRQRRRFVD
jgi:hypothetical protein